MTREGTDDAALHPFQPIRDVCRVFTDFDRPWFVAGGWAIDLFLGAVTRPHEDLEVTILREDQEAFQHMLAGWSLSKIDDEQGASEWVPWCRGERLELPNFQTQARRSGVNLAVFDVFLTDAIEAVWQFRRDPRITRPVGEIGARSSIEDIPYVVPEIVLLYKAKYHRAKDEHDFEQALPRLAPGQRGWLCAALLVHRPDDPWLAQLGRSQQRTVPSDAKQQRM
jgi:hypothetical protein